ncbi:MarR family winged helix-turn-helix transcriptional regulator, partial [Micrococcus luteus]|uniref:MarR family winged helix-turn-helix transcriptional regulator n=1 Tax=Micrococcus luteus TaxID=1270 RepID=UPI003791FB7F
PGSSRGHHWAVLMAVSGSFPGHLWAAFHGRLHAGALGVGALRDRLGMDNGTITPLVRRLAGMGLVTRERDVHDERRVLVRLTDEGRALRASARTVPVDALTRIPLDATERQVLMDLLNRITEAAGPR